MVRDRLCPGTIRDQGVFEWSDGVHCSFIFCGGRTGRWMSLGCALLHTKIVLLGVRWYRMLLNWNEWR